ncbi:hypothetical protein TSUD_47310 [Trifolium subterraneum]|nr:hypothetical protein TSUD_47310 [Trifolium subterraneum]
MLSWQWTLFSLLPLFFTLNSEANDQLVFRYHACNQDLGNFTKGSVYENNRDNVVEQIYSNKEINYGFYNVSYGEEPDRVNAIGFCRGDVNPTNCRECLRTSAVLLTDRCPLQKEAIGYYDLCTLRYSNNSLFGVMKTETGYVYNIETKTLVDGVFNQTLNVLLDELKGTAADGDFQHKFAEKSVKVNDEASSNRNETIYGLVQCTPDLSKEKCTECLDSALGQFSYWCKQMKGCLYLGPSCSVRYDITPFFQSIVNNTESPAPQPSQALPPALSPQTATSAISINTSTSKGKSRKITTAITIAVAIVVAGIVLVGIWVCLRKRKPKPEYTAEIEGQEKNEDEVDVDVEEEEVEAGNDLKVGDLLQFDFATIRLATSNFSDANKLGQGGFGSVYKGTLSNGQDIAIKRLANNSEQGETEFKNEVLLTGKLQHRNLVKLLDPIKRASLNWERRYKIIRDIARGLLYLHEDSRLQIVHRDLKTSNILLDEEMNPKITDFGIARLFDPNQTHGMTKTVIGTYGYMAPEYIKHGQFSVKSDVFSFGVIILEIICGQRNTEIRDGENIEDLLSIAWKNWKAGTSLDIVDPILHQGFNKNEKLRSIHVGLLCVQEDIDMRPTMSLVLLMLNSTSYPLPEPSEPPFLMQPKRALSIHLNGEQYSDPMKSSDSGSGSRPTQGSTTKSSATD